MRVAPAVLTGIALAVPAPVWAAGAPLTAGPIHALPAGSVAADVAVGDFDADGRMDLVVSDDAGGKVRIRLGNGDGTFRAGLEISQLEHPGALAVADFTGDGIEDFAVAAGTPNSREISVFSGLGGGMFGAMTAVDLPGDGIPSALAVGDFNTDGRADLAARGAQKLSVRLGAAANAFTTGPDLVVSDLYLPVGLVAGDFDGNGTDDLATALVAQIGSAVGVVPGRGDGSFETLKVTPVAASPAQVVAADLDADARLDLLTPDPDGGDVGVWPGQGDGFFSTTVPPATAGPAPVALAVADLDQDGHEDFVVGRDDADLGVSLGRGDAGFRDAGAVPAGAAAHHVAVADFDDDGDEDVAVGGGPGAVAILLGSSPRPANLLLNGDFEQGPGAGTATGASNAVPGWTTFGGTTVLRYGGWPHFGVPTWTDGARYGGGRNFLSGGNGALESRAEQAVDLGRYADAVDGGRATATLSALLGGGLSYPDRMTVRADLSGAGGVLRSVTLGPVTAADRRNGTRLLPRAATFPLPAGTRSARVTVTSTDTDRYSSAIADSLRLSVDVREPDPGPVAEPSPSAEPAPAVTPPPGDHDAPRVTRVRVRRGRVLRFVLSEPARVQVRITRGRGFTRMGVGGANRVRLRRLRRGRHRLLLRATDAAGNQSVAERRFRR